jgi:hypothetical protein
VVLEDGLVLPTGSVGAGGATVPVKSGTHTYVIASVPACAPAPTTGCRGPVAPHRAFLQLRRGAVPGKNRLLWKWTRGAATGASDFGNPLATTGYGLCIYGAGGILLDEGASAPAGGSCGARACWRATPRGYRYVDRDLTPSGLRQVVLDAGAAGRAQILVKGRGALLALPSLPITTLPVTVQLVSSDGTCWEATYGSASRNQSDRFAAKSN